MSSLYRQYRPQVFESVIGQDHISQSLTNALKKGLVSHAYLFSGPRGTGKTTLARLFARAINCPKRGAGENPCNKCDLCLEISEGRSVDVFEIDAASNRGIDEIRELRDRIAFAPTRAKHKVYIIDEVHMMTKEAFNALLKTLEEPPPHAIFILATTELHKVPDTIISRCQRYAFHRASTKTLTSLLETVAKAEKLEIDPAGLAAVAERAEGSYRDALTLLSNIAAHEGKLDEVTIRELLGLPSADVVDKLIRYLIEGDTEEVVSTLRSFVATGGDLAVLTRAVADSCKQGILHPRSSHLPIADLTRLLEALLLSLSRSRHSADSTAVLLAAFVGLSHKSGGGAKASSAAPTVLNDVARVEKPRAEEPSATVDSVVATAPGGETIATSNADASFWERFLNGIKSHNHALYMVVRSARLEGLSDNTLTVAVRFRFYVDRLEEVRNKKLIEAVVSEITGRSVRLETVIRADLDQRAKGGEDAAKSQEDDELVSNVVDVFELEEAK